MVGQGIPLPERWWRWKLLVFLLKDVDLRVQAGLTAPSSKHHTNPREKIFLKTINFDCKDKRNLPEPLRVFTYLQV
ncbi:hypothetical protein GCM10011405_08640 [Rufibacter glacialis]|nr:hypothetical protein GCM10011405_08640 [Rufibacter glacialis]